MATCPKPEERPENWLRAEFERARKRRQQLPLWARPVATKPRRP